MPTIEHNGLIELFRENPALAPRLLELLFHIDVPAHASIRVADSSLDQLIPIEFRADLVLELLDSKGAIVLSIVLESQRDKNPRKKFSWPAYVAVARAERESPTVIVVIAIDAHGNGPDGLAVLTTAFGAFGRLDHEHAAVYFQIVWDVLREPMRRALEALVMERQTEGKATFPPFAQQLIERGKLEGRLEGLHDGELKGLRYALERLLARARIALTEDDRARIQACDDAATLDRWIENVIGAKTAADVLS